MTFWIVFALVLALILGTARWVDRRAKRRHSGGLSHSASAHRDGANDVMGKDYGVMLPRHATDRDGGGVGGF